jgi:all-trans-retinol 13,14-reductase
VFTFILRKAKPIQITSESTSTTKQGFAAKRIPKDIDAIVIGSGIGGLTTAGILAKSKGYKVLVLEQHDVAGGNCHTFEEHGFEFDTGVHYIGGDMSNRAGMFRATFDYLTDNKLQWDRMDEVYDVAVVGKERYNIRADHKRLIAELKSEFPGEEAAIDQHFKLIYQSDMILGYLAVACKLFVGLLGWTTSFVFPKAWMLRSTKHVLDGMVPVKCKEYIFCGH